MKTGSIKNAVSICMLAAFFMFPCRLFSIHQVKDKLVMGTDTLEIFKCGYTYLSPLQCIGDLTSKINTQMGSDRVIYPECARGFVAEWVIKDSILYLSNVEIYSPERSFPINRIIEKVLNRSFVNGLLLADWMNEELWMGTGIIDENVYKKEKHFRYKNGKIITGETWNERLCKTWDGNDFSSYVFTTMNWKKFPKKLDEKMVAGFYIELDTSGAVRKVQLTAGNNEKYDESIRQAILALPCLPVYYHAGMPVTNRRETIVIDQQVLDQYKK